MSFNFPNSPTEGQEYEAIPDGITYVFYSGKWNIKPGVAGVGSTITISDTAPSSPDAGAFWWESDTAKLWLRYDDVDSSQWVAVGGGSGGSGGGDDIDTTPVAATGSSLARVIPDWLAGAPIVEIVDDVLLAPEHLGAWLHMMNDVGSLVLLPDDWLPGMAVGVRQVGLGMVLWQLQGNAELQMPLSKADHTGISEQYEEIILKVISNSDGHHAVWGVNGGSF